MIPQLKIKKKLFRLKKGNGTTKERIIKDIRKRFEYEEDNYESL